MSTPILRRLRPTDAEAVFAAFVGHEDMARQGTVTTVEEARAYVDRLLVADSGHEPWAIAVDDELVGQWAFDVRGLERLELGHRVTNPASGGVARRAGFVVEGTEREKFLIDGQRIDVLTYGRLRSDPTPTTPLLPMEEGPSGPGTPD